MFVSRSQVLDIACRHDFFAFFERCFVELEPGTSFQDYWYLQAMAEALRQVHAGEVTRQIINVPPRSGKSLMITVAFTAFLLGQDPRKRIICVSYSEDLARSHAAFFRAIVATPWFKRVFPRFQILKGGDRATEIATTEKGFRYAVSISGSVMGRGADLIIGDDAMGPMAAISEAHRRRENTLWDTAIRTRLNNKRKGAIILVSQRLHEEDLIGHVKQSDNWNLLFLPAISEEAQTYRIGPGPEDIYRRPSGEVLSPDREPVEVLDQLRAEMGSIHFSAQYLQNPIPAGGNLIKLEWLRYYDERPSQFDDLVASWDTASTLDERSSFSVGTLWGTRGPDIYLLDLVRGRWETPELRQIIIRQNEEWNPEVTVIEETELGRTLVQDLHRTGDLRARLHRPVGDKQSRLEVQSARFETGRVYLPASAPWIPTYVAELLAFPQGRHDDQVDATSQALNYIAGRTARRGPLIARDMKRRDIVRR
ncbi:MAG: terminase [Beijerinckiaceae bacterium]|nr:MAG: terminase [Beijerinckiaceae bacterium]